METYIHNGRESTGPFTDEQLRSMLSDGVVSLTTLAWRQGEKDWRPLFELLVPGLPPRLPQEASAGNSKLDVISLAYGALSAVGWFVLLVIAGVAASKGQATPGFNTVIGLLTIGGMGLNLAAMILGIVAATRVPKKGIAIAGAILNGCELLGIILLMLIGMGMSA